MSTTQILKANGQAHHIAITDVDDFKASFRGTVLLPGDAGYDEARTIWNAMIDRRPAIIARCAGVADVRRSVDFARKHNLMTAVRGAGHNIAGNAVCDGGFVIDLSQMRSVRIDPESKTAHVEPGATLADFDHEAQAFGLATPVGINSTTGIAGLTLGAGFGWLTRKFGMTIDNLVGADVVTADGKFLHTNDREHPDLFWALRGGSGNFGVVTRFEFRLHKVGPEILAGLIVYPLKEAASALRKYAALAKTLPDETTIWAVLRKAPPLPFLPPESHGTEIVAFAVFHSGDRETGLRTIEPVRMFGKVLGEHVGPMPYTSWQKMFDPLLTPGARNYWKSHNFADLADGAVDTAVKYAANLPSSQCEIFFGMIGGASTRVPADAMAYSHRDAIYVMNVHGRWDSASEDKKCVAWAREFFREMEPYATGGVYVNFLTEDESDRVQAAYGTHYAKLQEIKKKYDPENLFRMNQNISPAS